ncbi:O-antigen ligase family protein [Thiobacillus sedimenti]|uniref:O-antigen ligase family protein n=1 Tax=Thiobacillus sedimenti TaxID=3110231 RepID=A0ABZ1CGB3_9PROT|nr:O-antigen ligase family protein [Thiobacillus sp. SCUT-2]WRS38415.1 O-antigen ligase family protein [Thiobacillus sp. SCUT-2]
MKTDVLKIEANHATDALAVLLTALALFAIQLPKYGTVLLLPALLLAWFQRSTFHIAPELKRIAVLFALYVAAFSVISTDPSRSAKGAYDILRGVLVFLPALWLGTRLSSGTPQTPALLVGLAFSVVNFAFPVFDGSQAFYGYYDNPNNVAVALTAHLFLVAMLFPSRMASHRAWRLLAFAIAFGSLLVLLVLANSRGSWLGVAAAFSWIVLLQAHIGRRTRIALVLAAGAAVLVLISAVDVKGFGYGTVGARLVIWKGLWSLTVAHHPWFGYGINYVKDLLVASGLPTLTAHNVVLEIFVSTGVVGLTAFLAIAYRLAAFLFRQNYARGPVLYAGIGGLTAFLVMGQFDLKFASFKFIAMVSCFLGLIYSQRLPPADANRGS